MSADAEHTPGQLLAMDEQTARQTLTVQQFERWKKLHDLDADAAETKAQWEEEAAQVHDLTVHADTEELGTHVDLYDNDALVHVSSDDRQFRQAIQQFDDLLEEADDEGEELADAVDEKKLDAIANAAQDCLDAMLVRWNGHDWGDLDDAAREAVLADARAKWGVDALVLGVIEAVGAVAGDRQDRVAAIDSFRGA